MTTENKNIDNIAPIPTESIGASPNYTNAIKASKKSNITKDNIGEIMLAQIPGLSMNVAQSLMEKYKTIKNLIKELEKIEQK